jgi:alpha-L-fucosidase
MNVYKPLCFLLLTGALAARPLPSANQLKYHEREVSMFMHFSMCTFAGCEQDTACRKNPPSLFQPNGLNTTQWLETAAALGAQEVCLTAHHTGGFALWQSNVTEYGVRQSSWRGGKADIVKEFVESCRTFNISPCLYFINAWDCYESGDTPAVYLAKQKGMLSELMNRSKYGKIDRFWFDQYGFPSHAGQSPAGLFPGAWKDIVAHVHKESPGTMMLPGPDGCLNPGEGGGGAYPIINYVNDTLHCSYNWMFPDKANSTASIDGVNYVPFESDLSIQNPGDAWFWHKGHVFDTGTQLWQKYLNVVGRGSHFILNNPPNTTGIIPEEFVQSVTEMGDAVRKSFGVDVGSTDGTVSGSCSTLEVVVKATGVFDAIVIQEDLSQGQYILGYSLEMQDATTKLWTPLQLDPKKAGQTIGQKSIIQLPASLTGASAVRIKCTKAIGGGGQTRVNLASMSLHKLVPPPLPPPQPLTLRSYAHTKKGPVGAMDTAPCADRDGGSCTTFTRAGYTLVREEAVVLCAPLTWCNAGSKMPAGTKRIDLIYDLKLDDNSLSDGSSAFTPAGYTNETTAETFYIYEAAQPSMISLDVYYNTKLQDHWVLASDASRLDATKRGYTKVGTLGYAHPTGNHYQQQLGI